MLCWDQRNRRWVQVGKHSSWPRTFSLSLKVAECWSAQPCFTFNRHRSGKFTFLICRVGKKGSWPIHAQIYGLPTSLVWVKPNLLECRHLMPRIVINCCLIIWTEQIFCLDPRLTTQNRPETLSSLQGMVWGS